MKTSIFLTCVLFQPLASALADIGDPHSWQVGEQVFFKEGANVGVDGKQIEIGKITFPSTVEIISGKWLWVGTAWLHRRDALTADQALAHYSEQIGRHSTASATYRRAVVWSVKDQFGEAIRDFDKAIEHDLKYGLAYLGRGIAWFRKGGDDAALSDFTKAIQLMPSNSQAYLVRGLTLIRKLQVSDAQSDLSEAIRIDPNYLDAYLARAQLHYSNGNHEEAIKDWTRSIHLDPRNAGLYYSRGFSRYEQGEFDEAIKDFDEVIRRDPKDAKGYNGRGWAKYKQGDLEGANQDFKEAERLAPQYPVVGLASHGNGTPDSVRGNGPQAEKRVANQARMRRTPLPDDDTELGNAFKGLINRSNTGSAEVLERWTVFGFE